MTSMLRQAIAITFLFGLAACQSSEPPRPAVAAAPEPRGVTPTAPTFRLPEGQGCSGEIARFRAIQANDLETGHVTKSVYDQIEAEMQKASAMCAAGQSAQAVAHVRATKARFGYPSL
jgi:hypothetical protein